MQHFFNTIHQSGTDLLQSEKKAKSQDETIVAFFERHPSLELTPFEVQENLKWYNVPITSIRRSLNTLTNKGRLIKTDKKAKGIYGMDNYKWRYNFKTTLF